MKIDFPDTATKDEREINWQKIAEISDKDFGFNDLTEAKNNTRFNTRIVLENPNGQICIIKSEKYGYMQIPGGGIDEGETILEGLRREAEEEAGCLIRGIKPLGYIIEHREGKENHHPWDRAISFVFKAVLSEQVGTKYTDDEIAEGFAPIWLDLDDVIEYLAKNEGNIKSYSGSFSNRRDLEILKYYQKTSL